MEISEASASADGPHPVDIHIGQRIRAFRTRRGLSQSALGERIGITFQQVQKYERGINRVSGSRLYQIAGVLGVSISDYYEGLPDPAQAIGQMNRPAAYSHAPLPLPLPDAASLRLVEAFTQLSPRLRKASYDLIAAVAGAELSRADKSDGIEGGYDET